MTYPRSIATVIAVVALHVAAFAQYEQPRFLSNPSVTVGGSIYKVPVGILKDEGATIQSKDDLTGTATWVGGDVAVWRGHMIGPLHLAPLRVGMEYMKAQASAEVKQAVVYTREELSAYAAQGVTEANTVVTNRTDWSMQGPVATLRQNFLITKWLTFGVEGRFGRANLKVLTHGASVTNFAFHDEDGVLGQGSFTDPVDDLTKTGIPLGGYQFDVTVKLRRVSVSPSFGSTSKGATPLGGFVKFYF